MTSLPPLELFLDQQLVAVTPSSPPPPAPPSPDDKYLEIFKQSVLAGQMPPDFLPRLQLSPATSPSENPYTEDRPPPSFFFKYLNRKATSQDIAHFQRLPLSEQLKSFLDSQTMTPQQIQTRWQLAADLLFLLRQLYPQCELYVFGSLLTGLGDCRSDIDVYLDHLGDGGATMDRMKPWRQQERIFDLQDKVSEFLWKADDRHCPQNNGTITKFADSVELLGSRVPLVRLVHYASGISVDISFGNRISVQNSLLFRFYMDFDPRVQPLLQLLRYWLEFVGVAGSQKIKKYALSLLVLVYLNRQRILPTIALLQTLAQAERYLNDLENPHEIDGWDASFCTDRNMIDTLWEAKEPSPVSFEKDPAALFSMAKDFFQLICGTDWKEQAFCPLVGKVLDKETLINRELLLSRQRGLNSTKLAKLRDNYRSERSFCRDTGILHPFCVLDPFTLNFNVGRLVDAETLGTFCTEAENMKKILEKGKPSTLLDLFPQ